MSLPDCYRSTIFSSRHRISRALWEDELTKDLVTFRTEIPRLLPQAVLIPPLCLDFFKCHCTSADRDQVYPCCIKNFDPIAEESSRQQSHTGQPNVKEQNYTHACMHFVVRQLWLVEYNCLKLDDHVVL